jgi:hypothetical protein
MTIFALYKDFMPLQEMMVGRHRIGEIRMPAGS